MGSLLDVLGLPLLACVPMVVMLGYLGLHVLKREIVFIDIALAQIAAVSAVAINASEMPPASDAGLTTA